MARQVLPIAGAIVGAYFGNPQLGYAIGSIIGNAVDPLEVEGNKIGDNPTQTAAEGGARAIVFGRGCIRATCLLDRGNRQIRKQRDQAGKGGGPVTNNQRVFWTFAIGLGEDLVGGAILRIWSGEKLVYDATPESTIPEETAEFAQKFRFYDGSETQLPDPALEAIHGIGNTPYYRGTAYIVFPNYDLTDTAESIPTFRWEVAKSAQSDPIIGSEVTATRTLDADLTSASIYMLPSGQLAFMEGETSTSFGGTYTRGLLNDALELTFSESVSLSGGGPFAGSVMTPVAENGLGHLFYRGGTNNYPPRLAINGAYIAHFLPSDAPSPNWWGFEQSYSPQYSGLVWFGDSAGGNGSFYLGVRAASGGASYVRRILRFPLSASGETAETAMATGVGASSAPYFWMTRASDGMIHVIGTDGELDTYNESLSIVSSETLPFSLNNLIGFGVHEDVAAFVYSTVVGTKSIVFRSRSDWSIIQTIGGLSVAGTYPVRIVFSEFSCFVQVGTWVGRIPCQIVRSNPIKALLADVVSALHQRAGHFPSQYDVSELLDEIAGVVFEASITYGEAINQCIGPYFADPSDYDKCIHYLKRGKPVAHTLTEDDLVDEPEESMRENAIEYPRKLHLFFQSPITHYAATKATSYRSSPDVRVIGETSIAVPITFNDPDEPAQISAKLHKTYWMDAEGEIIWHVPDNHLDLVVGDCVGLSYRGMVRRTRITRIEDSPGVRKLVMRADRQSAYASEVTGIPLPPPTPPLPSIISPTLLAVLDIPALVDTADDLHYLSAMSGVTDVWAGAALQRSLDAGANYVSVGSVGVNAIMGTLQSTVTAASPHFTDSTNVVRVQLFTDDELESRTNAQWLSEQGAFVLSWEDGGQRRWEILQARDVDDLGDSVFELSHLMRGVLNTEAAEHVPGAMFVWLDGSLLKVSAQTAWLGNNLTHRAVSNGLSPETAAAQTLEYTGNAQREWPVAHLFLELDGTDLRVRVVPRHRFGTQDNPVRSANWDGYAVNAWSSGQTFGIITTSDELTIDVSGWTGTITVEVAQLNRLTGNGPWVTETIEA